MWELFPRVLVSVLAAGLLLTAGCTDGPDPSHSEQLSGPDGAAADEDDSEAGDDPAGSTPHEGTVEFDPRDPVSQADAIEACMQAAGYATRRLSPTSIEFQPTGDPEGRREAHQICRDRYPLDVPEVTPEWLGRLYDALLESAECLRDKGVNVSDPPSREAFIEDPMWTPYASAGQIAGYSESQARRFEEACPQPWVD